ncbi:MAG TPA: hypothetical protein PKJ19_07885 [Flavobacteriales bacterium]|nr:hypothetical protein [Flavobacteriales bacterium]
MSLLDRIREEQMLFAYWKGVNRVFPGFSDKTVIDGFIKDFGHICKECGVEALRQRLMRMKVEYLKDCSDGKEEQR